jgi:membrane protein
MASHVALSWIIAIFPFLIFTTSMAGFFSNETERKGLIELVFNYWPAEIAEPIIREMDAVLNHDSAGFLTLGIVLALFFATNGIEAVRSALNRAYQDHDPRSLLKQRAQSLLFILAGAILVFAMSVLLIVAPLYYFLVEVAPTSIFIHFFQSGSNRLFAAFGLLTYVVFSCHYWLPGHRRSVSQIWPGVALTLVLWIVAGKLFTLYLKTFATYNATYAGLAGIMTALIFLYLMAVILIFGAEYNSAREKALSDQSLNG